MTGAIVLALRRCLAAVVLIGGTLLAIDIGTYSVAHIPPTCPTALCVRTARYDVTPAWAIPISVIVGLLSVAVALLIYRPRAIERYRA